MINAEEDRLIILDSLSGQLSIIGPTLEALQRLVMAAENSEIYKSALAEIKEVYIGTDGGSPETVYEAYLLRGQKEMYQIAADALKSCAPNVVQPEEDARWE